MGKYVQQIQDEQFTIHIDHDEEDLHIDFKPTATWRDKLRASEIARKEGLSVMDELECEPDDLPNGGQRYWMVYA